MVIQGAAMQLCVTFTLGTDFTGHAELSVGRKNNKKKEQVSYMKILNGNFPPVLGVPHLPFRTKSCQGQAGPVRSPDRPCCMGSKRKGKRQMRQYFVLRSCRLSLQTRSCIHVQRAMLIHLQKHTRRVCESQGKQHSPLGRKKPHSFSVGP